MANVTLENVRKEFGSIVAVEGFDLTIDDDEFITLVGPSGCGKTTTLRMLAGLETPTSGTITIDGRDVTELPPQERNIAMLFQDVALYPHMTIRDNMAYGLKLEGMSKEERYRRVEETAALLQIEDQLDSKPAELSGGQQQRAALGRSMVREPSVFLFDEPMSDLDAQLKRELRPLFEEVTSRIGCPTLYVTHDQEEAMTMSDRIVVMNDGRIEQVGTPTALYEEPRNAFVAEFIGNPKMQFFEAELVDTDGTTSIKVGDDLVWSLPGIDDESPGRRVNLAIRPQNIEVSTNGSGIPVEHTLDEPLGNETHSFFQTERAQDGRAIVVTEPDFRGNGGEYRLEPALDTAKVFDAQNGERLV